MKFKVGDLVECTKSVYFFFGDVKTDLKGVIGTVQKYDSFLSVTKFYSSLYNKSFVIGNSCIRLLKSKEKKRGHHLTKIFQ